ncbi:MAG: MBL fold metallo-hydrolase [Pontixanthobacter sp.]
MNYRMSLVMLTALSLASPAFAQRDLSDVEIRAETIAPGIAVLFGAGGNIGVSYGEDGTILVDDQFAELTEKIRSAIAELGATPVEYLINTHWHGDHAGGNANFADDGATIFAHENVRLRLATGRPEGERPIPPAPAKALPIVTFDQGVTLHANGDRVDVIFLGGGHTDGDSVVYWQQDNVIHMGDLYFKIGGYPFIDVASGGNIVNAINSLDAVIRMIDGDTKVIPGHGPMSNKAELVAYRAMIGRAVELVGELKNDGMTLQQTVGAKPLEGFDRGEGFISADQFVEAVYRTIP